MKFWILQSQGLPLSLEGMKCLFPGLGLNDFSSYIDWPGC